jgi:hypothetical protein
VVAQLKVWLAVSELEVEVQCTVRIQPRESGRCNPGRTNEQDAGSAAADRPASLS